MLKARKPPPAIEADYIVVGAGSAGCVVASRLSEDGSNVLLLEAGPPDWHPMIYIPAGAVKLLNNSRLNWGYSSEPEAGTAGRRLNWPRGKVLGGSGSINGMNFVRGNAADFDGWAQRGCLGWSHDDVLPYFKSIEHRPRGDPQHRGANGPIPVENYRTVLPVVDRFVEAAQQAGFPLTPDINGESQEGVGYSQMNRTWLRRSTARTFLAKARKRPGLRVETGAHVTRLTFDGLRCAGVSFRQRGRDLEARAAREVILCGGAINSPQLLQVSGIGPAGHLTSLGIRVLADRQGVGGNLMDHYQAKIVHRLRGIVTINEFRQGWRLAVEALRWACTGTGLLTFGVTQVSVFCRSRPGLVSPDLQLLCMPGNFKAGQIGSLDVEPGISVSACPARPDSRGTVMAQSRNIFDAPVIRANYLSASSDQTCLVSGLHIARRILASPAISKFSVAEINPGPKVVTDEDLLAYARETGGSVFHPAGTCRMGEDPESVVDSRLRVRGIGGLRVIDASIMPTLTTGNIQAPVIMIGEKGVAMIRQDHADAAPARVAP